MTTFSSTRGGDEKRSFSDAFLSGYAKDGGMFMPDAIPSIDPATLLSWRALSYPDLAYEIFSCFISPDEIPAADLRLLLSQSFHPSRFPNRTSDAGKEADKEEEEDPIIHLRHFSSASPPFSLLELWTGPTLAFKDLGMSFAGHLLEYLLARRQQAVNVLVATSGDTGSAALHAVAGKQRANIFVLYPGGRRISRQQELQMTTVTAPNCHVIAIDGTSDDADVVLQSLFADQELKRRHGLTSINSVNVARILVQIVHFFWAWLRLLPPSTPCPPLILPSLRFAIPSGGMGNATAGMLAREMGLPCSFLLAVNANDTLDAFARTATLRAMPEVRQTLAPSMDIAVPYNLERILFLLAHREGARVAAWMATLQREQLLRVPGDVMLGFRECFSSCAVSDEAILKQIAATFTQFDYVLDPHTAIAVAALSPVSDHPSSLAQNSTLSSTSSSSSSPSSSSSSLFTSRSKSSPSFSLLSSVCVVATAHWSKFHETIQLALRDIPSAMESPLLDPPESIKNLTRIPSRQITFPVREHWALHLTQLLESVNQ